MFYNFQHWPLMYAFLSWTLLQNPYHRYYSGMGDFWLVPPEHHDFVNVAASLTIGWTLGHSRASDTYTDAHLKYIHRHREREKIILIGGNWKWFFYDSSFTSVVSNWKEKDFFVQLTEIVTDSISQKKKNLT